MDFECQEEGYLAKILVGSGTKDVAVGRVRISLTFNLDSPSVSLLIIQEMLQHLQTLQWRVD
jgi:hypothetical protein